MHLGDLVWITLVATATLMIPPDLISKHDIWVLLFGMFFALLSWIATLLRKLQEKRPTKPEVVGGAMGSLLGGYITASILITATEIDPQLVWTFCIISGLIGERFTYYMMHRFLGIDIRPDGLRKKKDEDKNK